MKTDRKNIFQQILIFSALAISGCAPFNADQLGQVTQGLYQSALTTETEPNVTCAPTSVFKPAVPESSTRLPELQLCWNAENTSDRFYLPKADPSNLQPIERLCALHVQEWNAGWPELSGLQDCQNSAENRYYFKLTPGNWVIVSLDQRESFEQCLRSQDPFQCPDFLIGKIPNSVSQ